ncbi:MAG: methyltransferase domain-containing protein [Calditrichaceae bacterium]|nr:methyltransferase domain-containing protein [Calditrichaceae bacterium]MBN2708171.1 methyltransferase domain-containing protein [Calditrichaceae bacterium]RQV97169.1 MAG: methyltransferase domain-containing protein [Calditrichota bacterium]
MYKLNLGSGWSKTPEDWINIDNSTNARLAKYKRIKKILYVFGLISKRINSIPWPDNIKILDVTKGLPFKENTVDCIFSSHFFEHISYYNVKKLLSECYHVLVPGGTLRIIVPDLQKLIEKYITDMKSNKNINNEKNIPANILMNKMEIFEKNTESDNRVISVIKKLQGNKNLHKWMYDEILLRFLLEQTGFIDIIKCDYGVSSIKNIEDVEEANRFNDGICMEAKKPLNHPI